MSPKAQNRRANPPKRRKKKERREDMKIIVSASQGDIYTWAISIALMMSILVFLFVMSIFVR